MRSNKTLVIQSHRQPLPSSWIEDCLHTVSHWALSNHYDYEFVDDALFNYLADDLLQKTNQQKIIATDLARLRLIQTRLRENYSAVVWCDADTFIFNDKALQLPDSNYALGREVWIQQSENNLRYYRKVHNAFMLFRQGNSFLDLYIDTAERLVRENTGGMPAQFIGPKLLTALHNVIQCPVIENAAVLSPLVIQDLLNGTDCALGLMLKKSSHLPAAVNLCHSSVTREEISNTQMQQLIKVLTSGDVLKT